MFTFIKLAIRRKWVLVLLLTAITWLITTGIIPLRFQLPFILYSLFVFYLVFQQNEPSSQHVETQSRYSSLSKSLLLFLSIIILLVTRFAPFIRYGEAPLGYDTGFYWHYFRTIMGYGTSTLHISFGNIAYTPWFPLYSLGLSALSTIHVMHLLHQLLAVGALYLILDSLEIKKTKTEFLSFASVSVFLFALSINQFMAYWSMFYKQSAALPFLLFALALFLRRSWLAIPIGALGAALHLQTAIPFGVGLFIFIAWHVLTCAIRRRPIDRELLIIVGSGLLLGITLLILKGFGDINAYIVFFNKYGFFGTNAKPWELTHVRGAFLPLSTVLVNTLFVLPFTLSGLALTLFTFQNIFRNRAALLPIIFCVTLLLTLFPFLYQQRNAITLDLFIIILAVPAMILFARRLLIIPRSIGPLILSVLILGTLSFSLRIIWNHPPQLYPKERDEIIAVGKQMNADDYIMATTALYTPWVEAYSGFRPTLEPGWLQWNRWDIDEWNTFWNTANNEERNQLLSRYGNHTIYIFVGEHTKSLPELSTFLNIDPHNTRVSPHIWRYNATVTPQP